MRPSQWIGDAAGTLMMIWERVFGDVARCPRSIVDVPVVSPTSQSRLEKLNSVQVLMTSPMHRRHDPVDAGTSPSLTTISKPGLTLWSKNDTERMNLVYLSNTFDCMQHDLLNAN